jgi:hypothetical protein
MDAMMDNEVLAKLKHTREFLLSRCAKLCCPSLGTAHVRVAEFSSI